jgi:transcriptional regulator with XRE-family HTH domain
VTGTQIFKARAGTLELSAYHVRVPWTGERLRRARGRLGLTQDELRSRLGDLAPDGKQPSGTSISDWETDRTKPGTKWAAVLDKLFAEEVDSEEGLPPTGSSDVDLSQVDDLHLLAEVARRMAGGHRLPVGPMPGPRLRWSRSDLPSTRRAAETAPDSPDTRDARA